MNKLNQLFEAKLASLQAAHEESRRKIIISATVRNRKGVDVMSLMESAGARRDVEMNSKKVYKQAADSECFKVMLDSMAPNSVGVNEFDDGNNIVQTTNSEEVIKEMEEEDEEEAAAVSSTTANPSSRSQSILRRASAKLKGAASNKASQNSEFGMELDDHPVGVSPTETEKETIF